jgi:chorismate synthase
MKYGQKDLRNILERASARETAARVAAGAVARLLLASCGVQLASEVLQIGPVTASVRPLDSYSSDATWRELDALDSSPLRCADKEAEARMRAEIQGAKERGDSLGGAFRAVARGLVPGLGSHAHWDRRLDGKLAGCLMSIGSVKAVWAGLGLEAASLPGSLVHDPISYDGKYRRASNNAGGLEGGITTGEPLILGAALKPIPTLYQPLPSVDIKNHKAARAQVERSDTCVAPAAAVVAEAMIALVLADAYLEKFGGDTMGQLLDSLEAYKRRLEAY